MLVKSDTDWISIRRRSYTYTCRYSCSQCRHIPADAVRDSTVPADAVGASTVPADAVDASTMTQSACRHKIFFSSWRHDTFFSSCCSPPSSACSVIPYGKSFSTVLLQFSRYMLQHGSSETLATSTKVNSLGFWTLNLIPVFGWISEELEDVVVPWYTHIGRYCTIGLMKNGTFYASLFCSILHMKTKFLPKFLQSSHGWIYSQSVVLVYRLRASKK